jgi:transketolase
MEDRRVVNHLKAMVINGVHWAQSGHPGGAMSSMDFAYILYREYLRFDPEDPSWFGRDRFILSAGHESMLLYSLLYAIGWLKKEDLKGFRSLGSKTPGHPENHVTQGVECTTGPLGQGAAMSVGMAIASEHLSSALRSKLFSSKTYALLGDGCMQEEVTMGAASLAGHLGLENLVWYYDQNEQQISGSIHRCNSCDFKKLFESFSWNVIEINGHNHDEIRRALNFTREASGKPTLIIGHTVMAKGAATQEGSHQTHGAPLSNEERLESFKNWGISSEEDISWPKSAEEHFKSFFPKKTKEAKEWKTLLDEKLLKDSEFHADYEKYFLSNVETLLPEPIQFPKEKNIATRNAFGDLLEKWAFFLPQLVGGSADLEPSNMTEVFAKKVGDFTKTERGGRNFAFGVREFTMSCVSNGISLYGGLIPFDATFLTFSDYSRAALRLGAIQKAHVIHEFTHDSFYVGEDGPTHQPIEHLMSLRSIPGLYILRPADARETEVLFRKALSMKAPSCLCLSRQKLPILDVPAAQLEETKKGAWVVFGGEEPAHYILFATGAEVHLAIQVARELEKIENKKGKIKVVSLSCWEFFCEQNPEYQNKILEASCEKRISIEAGVTLGWERFVGMNGLMIGLNRFGASGSAEDLAKAFGFTKEAILEKIEKHFPS